MKGSIAELRKIFTAKEERLTEAYEVRAYRDESEQPEPGIAPSIPSVVHADPGDFDAAKGRVHGHGEQTIVPDDCQFGDNDLCHVEA